MLTRLSDSASDSILIWRENSDPDHVDELRYKFWDASGDRAAWEYVVNGPGWSDAGGWDA